MKSYDTSYKEEGESKGFVKGATVRVLKKCLYNEKGWNNSWVEPMNKFIGNVYTIKETSNDGILLCDSNDSDYDWNFPWHVCEIIAKPIEEESQEIKSKITSAMIKNRKTRDGIGLLTSKKHLKIEELETMIRKLDTNEETRFILKTMLHLIR